MEVKEAVKIAKSYLSDLFEGERIQNLGLEEVEYDEMSQAWSITLGFSRPWDRRVPSLQEQLYPNSRKADAYRAHRDYKVVNVRDADGKVISVRNYETAA